MVEYGFGYDHSEHPLMVSRTKEILEAHKIKFEYEWDLVQLISNEVWEEFEKLLVAKPFKRKQRLATLSASNENLAVFEAEEKALREHKKELEKLALETVLSRKNQQDQLSFERYNDLAFNDQPSYKILEVEEV